MFKSIMWATDGSASADQAMAYVKSIASESNGEVVVFHADQLLMSRGGGMHQDAGEHDVHAKVERQAQELSDAGISSSARVVHVGIGESPAQTIAAAAEELGSDLIVVGTRGHTAFGGLVIGSVTNRLLHIAPCPVFVVPTAAKAASSAAESAHAGAHA
jgi:nucleotide-binding universal stress UspA family protein